MAKAEVKTENQYEGMFLFGAAAAADVEKSVTMARGIIERHGGKVLHIKKWDERKLTYEIKGQKRGLYVVSFFTAPTSAVTSIERDVNLSEDVLRVLVTEATHLNQSEMEAVEPQPIVPREERAPWDRPFEGGGGGGGRDMRGGDRGGDRGFDRPRPPREAVGAESDKN